jgi:S1-C subfamily serine protease
MSRPCRAALLLTILASLPAATPRRSPGWLALGYTYNSSGTAQAPVIWLFVRDVLPGGPAARAGVQPHDVITAINGHRLTFKNDIESLNFFAAMHAGDRVTLGIRRGARTLAITVVATQAPPDIARRREVNQALAKAGHQ